MRLKRVANKVFFSASLCLLLSVGHGATSETEAALASSTRDLMANGRAPGEAEIEAMQKNAIPMSLEEAIFLSLRNNPQVLNSELSRITQKFGLEVTQNSYELQYALTASANASFTRAAGVSGQSRGTAVTPSMSLLGKYGTSYNLTMNNPTDSSGIYNPGIDLSIVQPLLRGFGKDITLKDLYDAEDAELINRLNYRSQVISIVSSIITNYRSLIQSQNDVQTSQLALKSYQITIASDRALIKAGDKAPTEVVNAEAQYAGELDNLQQSLNNVDSARYTLLNNIGISPELKISVPSDVDIEQAYVPDFDEAFRVALENNIQYQTDLINLRTLRRALFQAEDNSLPDLTLSIDASTGNGSGTSPNSGLRSLTNNKNTSVGANLSLTVPIDDYGLRQAVIGAKVALKQAEINLAAQRRDIKASLLDLLTSIESSLKQIELSKHALKLKEEDQEFSNAKLRFGLTTTFEVTTKQQELNSARQRVIQNKISYLNNLTQLYVFLGILLEVWDIDLVY